jgi:hypothetical protein
MVILLFLINISGNRCQRPDDFSRLPGTPCPFDEYSAINSIAEQAKGKTG